MRTISICISAATITLYARNGAATITLYARYLDCRVMQQLHCVHTVSIYIVLQQFQYVRTISVIYDYTGKRVLILVSLHL